MAKSLHIAIKSMYYSSNGNNTKVIDKLQLDLAAGSIVSILGPSGCGKTTLLKIISGLEKNFDGKVKLGDNQVKKPTRDIQLVFQDSRLLPWKTVSQNLKFALKKDTEDADELVSKILKSTGLHGKGQCLPKTLSGGEQGRVALARALIEPSDVLLLDEPLRNVDLEVRYDLLDKLQKSFKTKPQTVILVSHCVEDAVLLSDQILVFPSVPMSTPKKFPINLPKPRRPDSPEVADYSLRIVQYILGKTVS